MSSQNLPPHTLTSEQVAELLARNAQLEKELHHCQAKLSEYRNLFSQVDQNFQSVFWLAEQKTREIVFVSSAFESIWQRPRTQHMKDMSILWRSTIVPEDWEHIETLLATAPTCAFEMTYRIQRPDGSIRWIRDHGFPIYDEQGEAYRIAGIGEDITDRKQAELELRSLNQELERRVLERTQELEQTHFALEQSESEFRTLVEHSPDIITRRDRLLRFTYVSPAVGQRGFSASNFIGKTLDEIDSSFKVLEEDEGAAHRVIEMGEPETLTSKVLFGSTAMHFQTLLVPEFDQTGAVNSVLSVTRDISSLKQAEAVVQQSEERFRRIFEDSPLGMGIATESGHFLMMNKRLCQIVGYSESELLTKTFWDITHPEDHYKEFEVLQQAIQAGEKILSLEKRFIQKDNNIIWVRITISLVQDKAGKTLHQIGMVEDISDRKKAEAELRASLQDKEVLLKEIHHRVKNNMQMVSSLLSLQASYIEDPAILLPFTESQNRVNAMALIHERLYRSNSLAKVSFSEYIHKLTSDLFRSYDSSDRSISIEFNLAEIELDIDVAIPCGLIVNELVSNALKHAFPNNMTGIIWVDFVCDDSMICALTIADNGVGIPEEISIYDSDSLGLQLVSAFTKKLHGKLQFERSKGSRIKVSFSLPLSR
ncbi:PAS domain S-box protein [Leptolyngbya sp. AN10]|uniref:PAS domain S-box protein n=1 Tax=Leptolyngbya sp. AN10 TaxID=3423365 RepID=UPI003D324076